MGTILAALTNQFQALLARARDGDTDVLYRSLYLPTQLSILSLVDVAAKIASNRRTERQNSRTRLVLSAKIDHGYHPRSTYESVSGVTRSGP
jgi:hypothetical protein